MNLKSVLVARRRASRLRKMSAENETLRGRLADGTLRVGLVSSSEYLGKVTDDLLLEKAFLTRGVNARRVAWQDMSVSDFDCLLVTSMWGYQNDLGRFYVWLSEVEKAGVRIFNPAPIIRANCDKVKQLEILDRAGVPHIETTVVRQWDRTAEIMVKEKFAFPFVIKPAISASGEGAVLVHNNRELALSKIHLMETSRDKALLVQPYVSEISEGELGVVVIDGKIVNAVRRFPGVFEGEFHVVAEPIDALDDAVREICARVLAAYNGALYARIDLVKTADGYKVMEAELFEPQLYYYLLEGEEQESMLDTMVEGVKKRVGASGASRAGAVGASAETDVFSDGAEGE